MTHTYGTDRKTKRDCIINLRCFSLCANSSHSKLHYKVETRLQTQAGFSIGLYFCFPLPVLALSEYACTPSGREREFCTRLRPSRAHAGAREKTERQLFNPFSAFVDVKRFTRLCFVITNPSRGFFNYHLLNFFAFNMCPLDNENRMIKVPFLKPRNEARVALTSFP